MSTTYWIKLYHEILDDPKMATLPDRLWRRVIELFLLAGRINKGGALPDGRSIAWMLRVNTDDLMADMQQLEATGIIEPIPGGWVVVKFAERQSSSLPAERMRAMRERRQRDQYYCPDQGNVTEPVTTLLRNVTQITDTDTDTEQKDTDTDTEQNAPQAAQGVVGWQPPETIQAARDIQGRVRMEYSKNIGRATGLILDDIAKVIYLYPEDWINEAITIAGKKHKAWNYVMGILQNKAEEAAHAVKREDYQAVVEK